ncbi:phage minor head protein [Kosakonia cowanii]|uniref:phage minor head protein n=1 Tax=Kosakonia cowanii TaxID=208223 RepID=UPI0030B979E3
MERLERYADLIEPWSEAVSKRLISTLEIADDAMWRERSGQISAGLRELMAGSQEQVARSIVEEQIKLFKSLPLKAADRVYDIHNQAIEAVVSGKRSSTLTQEIMRTGEVTEARARTIARTEVGRASTAITQARSTSIGSRGYIWRTARRQRRSPLSRADEWSVCRLGESTYARWYDRPCRPVSQLPLLLRSGST